MKPLLHAELINSPLEDPALFIEVLWEHRALLFDAGYLGNFRAARLMKISHIFITHTHIDHFIGFDTIVRLMLNREKSLMIFGPPGFLGNIRGKLSGYTWNLTEGYPFSILAAEVHPENILLQEFRSKEKFVPGKKTEKRFDGVLHEDEHLQFRAAHLNHLIPCLGFALQERSHININKEILAEWGFPVGPWLRDLKEAIWRGEGEGFRLKAPRNDKGGLAETEISIGKLKEAVTLTRGQKIAYVADCRFDPENRRKIVEIAQGADLFFCEAAFLHRDRDRAEERAHLTARQAGELAREAGAKELRIFHFSPKYEKETDLLYGEAEEAFRK